MDSIFEEGKNFDEKMAKLDSKLRVLSDRLRTAEAEEVIHHRKVSLDKELWDSKLKVLQAPENEESETKSAIADIKALQQEHAVKHAFRLRRIKDTEAKLKDQITVVARAIEELAGLKKNFAFLNDCPESAEDDPKISTNPLNKADQKPENEPKAPAKTLSKAEQKTLEREVSLAHETLNSFAEALKLTYTKREMNHTKARFLLGDKLTGFSLDALHPIPTQIIGAKDLIERSALRIGNAMLRNNWEFGTKFTLRDFLSFVYGCQDAESRKQQKQKGKAILRRLWAYVKRTFSEDSAKKRINVNDLYNEAYAKSLKVPVSVEFKSRVYHTISAILAKNKGCQHGFQLTKAQRKFAEKTTTFFLDFVSYNYCVYLTEFVGASKPSCQIAPGCSYPAQLISIKERAAKDYTVRKQFKFLRDYGFIVPISADLDGRFLVYKKRVLSAHYMPRLEWFLSEDELPRIKQYGELIARRMGVMLPRFRRCCDSAILPAKGRFRLHTVQKNYLWYSRAELHKELAHWLELTQRIVKTELSKTVKVTVEMLKLDPPPLDQKTPTYDRIVEASRKFKGPAFPELIDKHPYVKTLAGWYGS